MIPVILVLILASVQFGSTSELNGNITGTTNLNKTDSPYTVTSDVVITKDATLNVEPGVEIQFTPGVGLKVHGTLKVQGNSTSRITLTKLQLNETVDLNKLNSNDSIPYNEGVRLLGGANYRTGKLEIFIDNQWMSVCNNHWTSRNTQVACRMLGFLGARTYYYVRRVVAKPMQIGSVNCKGTEKSLLHCYHQRFSCHYYYYDIGVECYTLLPLLGERVYWSGIEYKDTANQVELRHVDIHKAYIGIRGHKILPPLYNVTITSSIKGISSTGLEDGFFAYDTLISGSMVRGIDISSNNVTLTLNNSIICNTTSGDGIEYSRMRTAQVDLSDVDPNNVSFPLYLTASTNSWRTEDVIKVFKTKPGNSLALHFQFLSGQGYYIEARDGDNINSTLLTRATQSDTGQTVSPALTTGNVLWIRYRHIYQGGASAEFVITESTDKSSLTIVNSKLTGNNGFGLALKDVFNQIIHIENTDFSLNSKDGMMAKNTTGMVSGSKLCFNRNGGQGLVFYDSSISICYLSDITAFGNQGKGIMLQTSWINCSISHASLIHNKHQGLLSNKVSGALNLRFCNISGNWQTGIENNEGLAAVDIYSSYVLQNRNHGLKLRNQGGQHRIIDSFIEENKQHGIWVHEIQSSSSSPTPLRQLSGIDIQGTKVSDNLYNGVYLSLSCQHIGGSTENVSIVIAKNTISNNSRGGLRLAPESWCRGSRYKEVSIIMSHNEMQENKNQAFFASCIALYRLKAEIRNNYFHNNSGQSIMITDQNNCAPKSVSNPVEVTITENQFLSNRGSNLVYIDFMGFPSIRKASVRNNTFENNTVKFLFPNLFQRTTDKSLVVFKEGTFTFQNNAFDANDCRYLLSTLYVNYSSIVDARLNWWGTKDECEIRDKIFDFYDRIQLAKVKYFPFFLSSNDSKLANTSQPHIDCFLNNNTVGGALDGELSLPRSLTPYKVRDDIVILENGSLRIPSNTTLMFPGRAAMLVQGELHVTGNIQEKVNFIREIRNENIRLSGGQGPWDGVLEFYTNDTWIKVCYGTIPLKATDVCRHLGYTERYASYSYISPKANDLFVFDIKCLGSKEDDIIQCRNKSLTLRKNCYRVSMMYCVRDYWAGVHLAFSTKKSELHQLNIYDAGFNYRSDISLPGYALRIDFDHHNMSNINIHSSSGIGIQVLFPSPFLKKSFIPNSKISHTASHGISLGSPYLRLTDVEVESTRAAGLYFYSRWDASTSHATQTMTPSIKKIDNICSQNITYLNEDDIVYLNSALPYGTTLTCQHLFVTEQGHRLGIQVLYSQLQYNRLHAFDGNNVTAGHVWKIETFDNKDRKVFNSSNNQVLLLLEKRSYYAASFHLLLFSVKEQKPLQSFIEIENLKFNQIRGGIGIYGNVISRLQMINCRMSNSGGYLRIDAREITMGIMRSIALESNTYSIYLTYATGDFGIYNSNISTTNSYGLHLRTSSSNNMENLVFNLFNCSIAHAYKGFVIDGYFSRGRVVVQNSTFESNRASAIYSNIHYARQNASLIFKWNTFTQNQGVTLSTYICSHNTECSITENKFEENIGSVITASSCHYRDNSILIKRNVFSVNQCRRGAVISLYSGINSLEASHNVFKFNQGTILMYDLYYHHQSLKMLFNIFKSNNCTGTSTIEIRRIYSLGGELFFDDNIFERNIGTAVLSTGTRGYCDASIQLRRNVFRYNLGIEKSVLHIIDKKKGFEATENDFHYNSGATLIFEGVEYAANLLFANNSIENNICMSREMVSILRMEGDIEAYNNTFHRNKAMGIMSVQSLHIFNFDQVNKSFTIVNNTFTENQVADDFRSHGTYFRNDCVLKLRGLLYYKISKFFYNKFENPSFDREFCLRIPVLSQKDYFNASHNWWGTSNNYLLRQRISDFDDNHDYAIASTSPFLTNSHDYKTTMFATNLSALRGNKLGGRVHESLLLTEAGSPYKVTSDLTVLPGVVLTIEPNVELRFLPEVSLLVIGTLIARGTKERKIKFTLDNPAASQSVRLKDGRFPWEGRLEVYHENKWMSVCPQNNTWNPANTKVICRELGYLPHQDAHHNKFKFEASEAWPYNVQCYGNESSLSNCNATEHSFASNATEFVGMNCKGKPWGNIEFVKPNENGSVMESSILEHVDIRHCGQHFNSNASAIESVMRTPKTKFIAIQNCSFHGFSYFLTSNSVTTSKVNLKHLQGNGINVIQSSHGVTIKDSTIEGTVAGVVIDALQQNHIPSVQYGRLSICDSRITTFDVKSKSIVFFELNDTETEQLSRIPHIYCQKEFRSQQDGKGVRIRLLFYQGSQTIRIYDKRTTRQFEHYYTGNSVKTMLFKQLIFPEIGKIQWYGNLKSRIMLEVDAVDIHTSDIPCNFQYGMCGWQSFRNMTINGTNMTTTWATTNDYYRYYYYYHYYRMPDNTFNSNEGYVAKIGSTNYWNHHLPGNASLVSPLLNSQSKFCKLVFYYKFGRSSKSSLNVFLHNGTNIFESSSELILLWKPTSTEVLQWRKVVLDLPLDYMEYRIIFFGSYEAAHNRYSPNFVVLDDVEIQKCPTGKDELENNIIRNNKNHAFYYNSTSRNPLSLKRNKFVTNGDLKTVKDSVPDGAVYAEMKGKPFLFTNNHVAGNIIGGISVQTENSDGHHIEGRKAKESWLYGNTFVQNGKKAFNLVSDKGTAAVVHIKGNFFSSNVGKGFGYSKHSIVKIRGVPTKIEGNFFFNNSGLFILNYEFFNDKYEGQYCTNNTFFLNTGTASEYGATIRTNGSMQYHGNSLKNPNNLYEIDTTTSAVTNPVNATKNWFGFGIKATVKTRLRGQHIVNSLPKILFEPFVKIQPRNILSLGCPPDWMNFGSTCYVFRPGVQSFQEADEYCKYYGGHILSSSSPGDQKVLAKITANISQAFDQPTPIPLWIIGNDFKEKDDGCQVLTHEGKLQQVPCNGHYSFACSRNTVVRCPNGCSHNGDCIGSTCFCYQGWTGEDCSQYNCRDVHNCSDVGKCKGPNLCRCKESFRGRACTYSYCSKFRNCSTCVSDQYCGWCDKTQECVPGDYSKPHKKSCSDWFYYNCYTVGSENHCSDNIWRVDCQQKQCNFARHSSNMESCAKCKDLEKCYNLEEAGKCRAWNVTRCPHGMLHVDYSDKSRINNTQLRSNVITIDPKNHTVYNCPVILPEKDDVISVFVVPRKLGVKVGHVMTSPQAGGIMHKVNETNEIGPHMFVLSEKAKVEDLIEYADFQEEVQPEPITDEVTEEEETDIEQINGMYNGDISLNNTQVHMIPQGKYIYKCVGHLYQIGSKSVVSHYLVMEAATSINASTGDVIVGRESHGFIEQVTNISKTETANFIYTMLERCDGNSTWDTTYRFKPRLSSSQEDDDITCTGGDNNPGLLISDSDDKISVNDSIIGRRSKPFISKVISSSVNGDYVIMEVLPVISVTDGTAATQVQIDELHTKHRRAKRDINVNRKFTFGKSLSHKKKYQLGLGAYLNVEMSFGAFVTFTIKIHVSRKRDAYGDMKMADVVLGMDISGEISSGINLGLGIERTFSKKGEKPIVKERQLGKGICIPVWTFVCIPSAFFLEVNLKYAITAKFKAHIPVKYGLTRKLFMGGTCSFKRSCSIKSPEVTITHDSSIGEIETKGKVTMSATLEPKLSYKLPIISPRFVAFLINKAKKLWLKIFKASPGTYSSKKNKSISIISLSVAVPFKNKIIIAPCDNNRLDELNVDQNYANTSVVAKLSAGFGNIKKSMTLFDSQVYDGISKSVCFIVPYASFKKDKCKCPTTAPPTSLPNPTADPSLSKTPPAIFPPTSSPTHTTDPSPCTCEKGQRGVPSKDTGECDCLPECKNGLAAVKINDMYECPEHPPCGMSPNCVTGRQGEGCSQPDFYPCTSKCSGNGFQKVSECQAVCGCSARWTGRCCETRLPARGFGDPHLETLDGIEFDYFGIGEFWGCRSIHNSFGLQYRFFAHKGTSLIGGIALKAGGSVLSVMSQVTSDPTDMPHLRVDGSLVNLTKASGKQLSIGNKTAFLEVQKQSNVKNEGDVVFFSLEYKTGVSVTIYVRHSNTMGRQFLNVLYTLTAEYKSHTEGVCGLMDNNPANDLTGPNGELYTDPVKFADSWRISTTHNRSGLYDSWSWNSSNFHADDVMDSTYTDPSHVPTYELSDVPSNILEKSRQICLARELPENLLKSCIYDIAATNDTSFAMQEALLTGCPDQCSGKGRCINQTCECLEGWSGEKCEIGSCPNCSKNGKCVKGYCQCNIGWQGETCSEKATCYKANNCTSPVHGICKTTNKCLCNDGYMGSDCSIIPTCLNVSSCSGHGKCVDFDVCKCDRDWTGRDCSQYSCADLDHCSGHGRCVNVYQCECHAGWTGISCANPDCPDVNQCSGNGTCVAPNKCQCYPGYSGNKCLDSADCSMLANCSDHGACVIEDGKNSSCRCYDGFKGIDCSQPTCNDLNNCSSRGVCKEAGFCVCDIGFTGSDCSNASCQTLNYCSGHGKCIDYDVCRCEPSWHGAACSIPDCTVLNDCSKQGVCLAPNKCECYPGYDGIKCDKPATPNYYPPVFSSSVYNVSVYENATLGSFVGQVNASDLDQGRNGEVMYFLSNDVGGIFTIEGGSGKIFTSSLLGYDILKTDVVILDVRASDNGKPMKLASCKVYIIIIDVNDNCPIFEPSLKTSYNISVNAKNGTVIANVSAVDKDNGVNGDVRYYLETGGMFSIDWLTGVIRNMHQVQPMSYHVVVIARDQGTPSCWSLLKLEINGIQKGTSETTTDSETSTKGTTTVSFTSKRPNITLSSTNDSLKIAYVIAGCCIGVCLLAVISTIIILRKKRMNNANKVVPKNKRNTSPKALQPETLEGDIPDFQDVRGIEMQVCSVRIPVNVPTQEST